MSPIGDAAATRSPARTEWRVAPAVGQQDSPANEPTRVYEPYGISADRRRAPRPRRHRLGDVRSLDPRGGGCAAGAAARRTELATVPAPASGGDRRLRLSHRRDAVAEADLHPLLHLARAAADRAARLDQRSRWCLGDAAGAQPPDGARRPATAVPPPDPRSRPQVQPQLRRGLPQRSDRRHQDAGAGAERERLRRALGTDTPRRLPRPLPDPERPPPRPSAPRLPRALQRASAAPLARPAPASRQPAARSSASQSQRRSLPARSPRRLDPRVRTRRMTPRMTTTEFLHPTRRRASRVPEMCPKCVRVFLEQTTTKC